MYRRIYIKNGVYPKKITHRKVKVCNDVSFTTMPKVNKILIWTFVLIKIRKYISKGIR